MLPTFIATRRNETQNNKLNHIVLITAPRYDGMIVRVGSRRWALQQQYTTPVLAKKKKKKLPNITVYLNEVREKNCYQQITILISVLLTTYFEYIITKMNIIHTYIPRLLLCRYTSIQFRYMLHRLVPPLSCYCNSRGEKERIHLFPRFSLPTGPRLVCHLVCLY